MSRYIPSRKLARGFAHVGKKSGPSRGRSSAYNRPGGKARTVDGMNGAERRYVERVLEPRRLAGEIQRWAFDPFSIKLAPRTYYRPDFLLWISEGYEGCSVEIHEVKGHWTDDARVKVKIAASMNPWFRFVVVYPVAGGGYEYEEIPPA